MNEEDPLHSLLQEWKAPEPSPALAARILARRRVPRSAWWRHAWSVRVSIPAPLLAAALLIAAGFLLMRRSAPPPAQPPASPNGGAYMTRLETAGFVPLPDGAVRVIRSGAKK